MACRSPANAVRLASRVELGIWLFPKRFGWFFVRITYPEHHISNLSSLSHGPVLKSDYFKECKVVLLCSTSIVLVGKRHARLQVEDGFSNFIGWKNFIGSFHWLISSAHFIGSFHWLISLAHSLESFAFYNPCLKILYKSLNLSSIYLYLKSSVYSPLSNMLLINRLECQFRL